jgi:hypothetical protein
MNPPPAHSGGDVHGEGPVGASGQPFNVGEGFIVEDFAELVPCGTCQPAMKPASSG